MNDPTESSADVRERYIDRHADTFVFNDRTRMEEALREVLAEEGYELVPTAKPRRFTTNKKDDYRSTKELSITILELMNGRTWIHIYELSRNAEGEVRSKTQRTDLEWLLAQRAEPDRALGLMKKANERADKVPPVTRKK